MMSLVLTGGVNAWAASGGEHVRLMEGYDESVWP